MQWPVPPEHPIRLMSRDEADGALMLVYEAVAKLAGKAGAVPTESDRGPGEGTEARPRGAGELVRGRPGALFGVPSLPPHLHGRADIVDQLETAAAGAVRRGRDRPVGGGPAGPGRIGKIRDLAATAIAAHPRGPFCTVLRTGIYWVTLSEIAPELTAAARRTLGQRAGKGTDLFHHSRRARPAKGSPG